MAAVAVDGFAPDESPRFVPAAFGMANGNYYRNTKTNEIIWHRHEEQTPSFCTSIMEGLTPEEIYMIELNQDCVPAAVETAITIERSLPPPHHHQVSTSFDFDTLRSTRVSKPRRTNRKRGKERRSKRHHKSDRKNAKFAKDADNGVHHVDIDDYYDYGDYGDYDDYDFDNYSDHDDTDSDDTDSDDSWFSW